MNGAPRYTLRGHSRWCVPRLQAVGSGRDRHAGAVRLDGERRHGHRCRAEHEGFVEGGRLVCPRDLLRPSRYRTVEPQRLAAEPGDRGRGHRGRARHSWFAAAGLARLPCRWGNERDARRDESRAGAVDHLAQSGRSLGPDAELPVGCPTTVCRAVGASDHGRLGYRRARPGAQPGRVRLRRDRRTPAGSRASRWLPEPSHRHP